MKRKIDLLDGLENAESHLSNDILALGYILDYLQTTNSQEIVYAIEEINNKIQTLLKSMMYNQKSINEVIKEVKLYGN